MAEVKRCAITTFITWIRLQLFRFRLAVCVLAEIAQFYVHVFTNADSVQFDEGNNLHSVWYCSAHLTAARLFKWAHKHNTGGFRPRAGALKTFFTRHCSNVQSVWRRRYATQYRLCVLEWPYETLKCSPDKIRYPLSSREQNMQLCPRYGFYIVNYGRTKDS